MVIIQTSLYIVMFQINTVTDVSEAKQRKWQQVVSKWMTPKHEWYRNRKHLFKLLYTPVSNGNSVAGKLSRCHELPNCLLDRSWWEWIHYEKSLKDG